MTLSEAKEEILRRCTELLDKDEKGLRYVCPGCKTGANDGERGLMSYDYKHFSCPMGCFRDVDIFGVLAVKVGTKKEENLIRVAANELNLQLEEEEPVKEEQPQEDKKKSSKEIDYSLFYKDAREKIRECEYLQTRGISKAVQRRFNLGYVEDWIHPSTSEDMKKYITPTKRIIVPMTKTSYCAIYTEQNEGITVFQRVGEDFIFNREAINEGTSPLFVVENEMDALSMIECGYEAISYGGMKYLEILMKYLEENGSSRLLIFNIKEDGLDEDEAQQILNIKNRLDEYKVENIFFGMSDKDPELSLNDVLVKGKKRLEAVVSEAIEFAQEYEVDQVREYQTEHSNVHFIDNLLNVKKSEVKGVIPTLIEPLDDALDGGLYDGLYTIYGEPTLGKTALALHLADNIALSNTDVLIFSLEAGRKELMSRSISKISANLLMEDKEPLDGAITARQIMSNTVGEDKHELFELACEMYRDYASNLYVYECDNTGVNDIKDSIVEFIKHTHKAGRRLSIVVDYVQVIADADEMIDTEGHSAAMNIVELKRISREFNIPVIAISSEYNDSIKNSSDVMLVLKANKEEGTTEIESMKKEPRELTMIVDKNRNGEVGEEIKLNYYSKYNLFEVKGN